MQRIIQSTVNESKSKLCIPIQDSTLSVLYTHLIYMKTIWEFFLVLVSWVLFVLMTIRHSYSLRVKTSYIFFKVITTLLVTSSPQSCVYLLFAGSLHLPAASHCLILLVLCCCSASSSGSLVHWFMKTEGAEAGNRVRMAVGMTKTPLRETDFCESTLFPSMKNIQDCRAQGQTLICIKLNASITRLAMWQQSPVAELLV